MSASAPRRPSRGFALSHHLLEASFDDVEPVPDGFGIAGVPARRVDWARVAAAACGPGLPAGMEPGLEATSYFQLVGEPWSFGACVAAVSVDPETGEVTRERLTSVDDCGVVVNPLLVAGQSHGALAQGVGQALCEWLPYDADGQPLAATLADYALPRARPAGVRARAHRHAVAARRPGREGAR